jgi:hypothetical protein
MPRAILETRKEKWNRHRHAQSINHLHVWVTFDGKVMRLRQLDAECRYVHHLWEPLVELSKCNIRLIREDTHNETPDGFTGYQTVGLYEGFDDWF